MLTRSIHGILHPGIWCGQFYWALGGLNVLPTFGGEMAQQNGGFKIFCTFIFFRGAGVEGQRTKFVNSNFLLTIFSQSSIITQSLRSKDKVCQSLFAYSELNSSFLLKIFFPEQYHDIKNLLIYKLKCNLRLF